MATWGADSNAANKPTWANSTNLGSDGIGVPNANLVAKTGGWVMERPWGDEIIVAIGGLSTNEAFRVLRVEQLGAVVNAASQNVAVRVVLSEGCVVSTVPTIVALEASALGANVTLSYSAVDSDPAAGSLVFKASASLAAFTAAERLIINVSSTFALTAGITSLDTPRTIATTFPVGTNTAIEIDAA